MKTAICSSLALFALFAAVPTGCSYTTTVDVANNLCAQMGTESYEYLAIDTTAGSFGSFEPGFPVPTEALIVDDDDLTDDYPVWVEATKTASARLAERPDYVAIWESIPVGTPEENFTADQVAAVDFVESIMDELLPVCKRLSEPLIRAQPGDVISNGYFPSFTACKDKYNSSGDGVVGTFALLRDGHSEQDAELAGCSTVTGTPNTQALNIWGPLSTKPSHIPGLPADVYDGFTYSGITVPLTIATYQQTEDRSMWDGISFWARQADAGEAIPVQDSPGGKPPYDGRPIPDGARAQDGVGQLGVMLQTMDTAAALTGRGGMDGMKALPVCDDGVDPNVADDMGKFPFCVTQADWDAWPAFDAVSVPPLKYAYEDAHGRPQTPELPYCIDYSPVDTVPGQETPFRNQCWDGFRTMLEITQDWKFYRIPFSEMRQAGWGRVADKFRIDQIRSVNLLGSAFQPMNVMVDEVSYYRRKPAN